MKQYRHITLKDRENLIILKNQGYTQDSIAREIGFSQSTVSRELSRNRSYATQFYNPEAHRAETGARAIDMQDHNSFPITFTSGEARPCSGCRHFGDILCELVTCRGTDCEGTSRVGPDLVKARDKPDTTQPNRAMHVQIGEERLRGYESRLLGGAYCWCSSGTWGAEQSENGAEWGCGRAVKSRAWSVGRR